MAIKRETPTGITLRARYFIRAHGHWADHAGIEQYRARWTEHSIPTAQIDRVASYERVWGGLILPPSPHCDGGPRALSGDVPERLESGAWLFEAGAQRTALPYSFVIGPDGEFGLHAGAEDWVALHSGIEGWVEALSLADHARRCARTTTTLTGAAVDDLDLDGFEAVPEVAGAISRFRVSAAPARIPPRDSGCAHISHIRDSEPRPENRR
ncbi:hypothetical protein [Streptomyces lavendulae]|uniref:hypothetical protein n=1 Tax=Streptomyces lavendulae TaxID=1914 RepID=UPI0024A4B614|nr:hypothetical protein [Streptomyces lavendulae]GLW04416.1 hypothetical protein Slala05_80460 [Streptomyces lavendulae subsp. lavendulae]